MYHMMGVFSLLYVLWPDFHFSPTAGPYRKTKPNEGPYHFVIARAAERHQVDIELIKAMIMVESKYDAEAVSNRGARGLMQLMPATAKMLGVKDCFDPCQNVEAGVAYFKRLKNRFNGNIILALAAYNAGPTRVRECGGIPRLSSTRQYIRKVLTCYFNYKMQAVWFPGLLGRHLDPPGADDAEEIMNTSAVLRRWLPYRSTG